MRITFLGLGIMGGPIARHLAAAGHDVTVYNRTPAKAAAWVAAHGGRAAATPARAAAGPLLLGRHLVVTTGTGVWAIDSAAAS